MTILPTRIDTARDLTIARVLDAARRRYHDSVAYVDGSGEHKLGEHLAEAELLAAGLHRRFGLVAGDRIAVLSATSRQYIAVMHAAMLSGLVVVPVNTRLAKTEIRGILADSGSRVVLLDDEWLVRAEEVVATADPRPHIIAFGGGGQHAYADVLADGRGAEVGGPPGEDDPVMILYTGGTTGRPKGAVSTQRALAYFALQHAALYELQRPGVVARSTSNLFHLSGLKAVASFPFSGARVVLRPRFEPAETIADIEHYAVTHIAGAPTMLKMILDHPDFDAPRVASIRAIAFGAAPMPLDLLHRLIDAFPKARVTTVYGMTEAMGSVTHSVVSDHVGDERRLASVGRAIVPCEVRVADDACCTVATGEIGEVLLRTPALMREYLSQPETTAAVMHDGWYRSGDLGYLDEEGYLYLVGRRHEMIISGGENVYAGEVEAAIQEVGGISQVAVFGIPNEHWGEAVHAIIVPEPGRDLTVSELEAHLRERLARYKQPKTYDIRTEPLPLSASLKILKQELRAPFWS